MKIKLGIKFNLPAQLTKEQQKIIYIGLVVFVFFACFWGFIYGPQSRKLAMLKADLARTESQIAEISRLASGGDLTEAVKALKVRLNYAAGQLPGEDEIVIKSLLGVAKRLRIEVSNLSPASIKTIEGGVAGYNISEFPISMRLSCDYKTLGEYLHILRKDFPVLIKLRQLDIRGKGEGQMNLEINLQLLAYLASEKK